MLVLLFVIFFVSPLAALLLLSRLPVLLPALTGLAFLAMFSGLVALVSRLSAVLTGLATLLPVLFHIVRHGVVLPFMCATWRFEFESNYVNLVAEVTTRVGAKHEAIKL